MSALSLKRFEVNPAAQGREEAVHAVGRQSGLVSFILSIMKIDPITELKCNDERLEVTQSSFFGRQTITIPLAATTGIVGGYKKPKSLVYAMIIILFGSIGLVSELGVEVLMGALVIDAILFVYYLLYKELSLYVQNGGDTLWGMSFKRSVIENISVDINRVNEAIMIINQRVLAVHLGK